MTTETKDEAWPLQDYKAVLAIIKGITVHAVEFDAFEADFLTEVLRCAVQFKTKFRLSPKQLDTLAAIEAKFLLAEVIKAKTKPPTEEDRQAQAILDAVFPKPESKP